LGGGRQHIADPVTRFARPKRLRFNSSASIIASMNQAFQLYQLQKTDSQYDQASNRLNEIERILQEDETLRQAEALAASAEHMLKHAHLSLQKAEDAVQAQRIKIEENEAALYSGRIRSPKELQDLQNEVAALKRYQTVLEDHQLEAMMALEEAERDHQRAKEQLANVQASFATQKAGLLGEQSQLQKNRERSLSERNVLLSSIAPENLETYERLRKQKRGIAVATIVDEACTACGAMLTPAEWQAARSPQKMVFCPSCGRLLYAG